MIHLPYVSTKWVIFLFCLYILEGKSYIYFWSFQQTGQNTLYSFTINLCYNIFPLRFKPKVPSWWNLQSLLGILLMQVSWTEIGSSDSAIRFSDPAKIVRHSFQFFEPPRGRSEWLPRLLRREPLCLIQRLEGAMVYS